MLLKSMRKSKNRYFYHIFVSPGDAPGAIMLNVVWMKDNSMLTNCLAACVHLTIIVSEIERYIDRKSSFFSLCGSSIILVFPYQTGCRYSNENPLDGGRRMQGWYDKITIFSQISRCISQTVIVRWAHAARQFVSIEFSFHRCNI